MSVENSTIMLMCNTKVNKYNLLKVRNGEANLKELIFLLHSWSNNYKNAPQVNYNLVERQERIVSQLQI